MFPAIDDGKDEFNTISTCSSVLESAPVMGENFEKTVKEIMDMMGHGRDEVSGLHGGWVVNQISGQETEPLHIIIIINAVTLCCNIKCNILAYNWVFRE